MKIEILEILTAQRTQLFSRGDDWQDEKKSACRISIKAGNSYGWCSGALINNTANDCTPYVLTADHCAYGQNSYASAADHNQWVFYFNFEACTIVQSGSSPNSNTIWIENFL